MHRVTDTFYDAEKRIWSGPKEKEFYGSEMTIGDVVYNVLSQDPCRVVQVMDPTGETLTAGDILKQSQSVALNFLAMGLKLGDIVGISAGNTPHLTAVVLASFLCGTPVNAIYPQFDKETVKIVYGVTRPKIIFCDVENFDVTKQATDELNLGAKIFILNGEMKGVANITDLFVLSDETASIRNFPCSKLDGDSAAVILCSSGTTGPPKGVICSHKSLLNSGFSQILHKHTVLFTFSNLYWASGIWTLVAALKLGIKRVITDLPFTPEYFMQLIEKHKITNVFASPAQIMQVIATIDVKDRHRLDSIHTILCGGAKVPEMVPIKFNQILGDKLRPGLVVTYGMSELSGTFSADDGGPGQRRPGTEGKLSPNILVRIVDKNGNKLGVGEQGIIMAKAPFKWAGYYKNPEATMKSYKDGWLNSGDIGYFDKDGYLTICSRESEVFKSNNFQIYPQNIEKVVLELPGVLEVCVVGLPHVMATNLIACAVVVSKNLQGQALTKSVIESHVKSKLAEIYHLSGGVYFMDTLPRTGSDKVIRRKVLEAIQNSK